MGIKINIIGAGYVGLVTGVGLTRLGFEVVVTELDVGKVANLSSGVPTIHEDGLESLLLQGIRSGRLKFGSDLESADVYFICVGTPEQPNGSCNLDHFWSALDSVSRIIPHQGVIVTKSTVPVGTGMAVLEFLAELGRADVSVVSNPEFLREGSALNDFFHPDRIVIGGTDQAAIDKIADLYSGLDMFDNRKTNLCVFKCDLASAELIKHASNAYLATRLSFVNEVSVLCSKVGANPYAVAEGMGLDNRIGSLFLSPGPGWGGSCFPKDTKELVNLSRNAGATLTIVETAEKSNQNHKKLISQSVISRMKGLLNKKVAVLGLAFKADTDDVRESPSIQVIQDLLLAGFSVTAYDPVAMENFKKLGFNCHFSDSLLECVTGAEAAVFMTEWHQFRQVDMLAVKDAMSGNIVFDFRNLYSKQKLLELGFEPSALGD